MFDRITKRAAEAAVSFGCSSCLRDAKPHRPEPVLKAKRVEFPSSIHGGWHEAIGIALFGDIPDARESEVIADERELILHRHIENSLACLGGHPGIRVKVKYPIGMAEGNRGVCDGVTRKEEILARRRQEIRRMSRRVAGRRYDANAFDGVFAVFEENQAVFVGQQVLARGIDEKFSSRRSMRFWPHQSRNHARPWT